MTELASRSLDLVNRELTSTLETARREIEDFVDGHADTEGLLRAASMLHLASGALKIVEIHGAALLAEEMEQTCRALVEFDDQDAIDQGVEALTRAMIQLPAYLDRLLSGGSDVALVLLPLLNDLRTVRNKPLLSEGTLLLLNTGPFERFAKASGPRDSDAPKEFGPALKVLAQRVRPSFQAALLGWIRGDKVPQNLAELIKLSEALEGAAESEPVRQLWRVVVGVLVALQANGLEASVPLKRLLGQVDRQLKRLIDAGEAVFLGAPPMDLLNSLLYYVARAKCDDSRVAALRESFGLEDAIPGEEQIQRARENLAGPSVKLMQTVAQAIKEDLGAVKDVLDIFVRTGMEDVAELRPQIDMLKKIGDTLGVLGLEAARSQIQDEVQALSVIVANNKVADPTVLERTAATLLDVEDALARELVRAIAPQDEPSGAGIDEDEDDADSTHYRHVTHAVMGECIVNLARIKEAVVRIVADPKSVHALDQVRPQLRGITAGLLMLNKTKAVRVVERIGTVIETRLAPGGPPLKQEHLERLADAIVSVEYYMETVSVGRGDPWYMLDNAERCLDLLERLPVVADAKAAVPEPAEPEPPPAAPAKQAPLSVMEVAEDRSEPELVEIFIEEAKEEIANIRRNLPSWIENPVNSEALISVRRSFHTIKGSGRMVGAQLLGEFAWSVENLLNRVINQTLEPTPPMVEFVKEAVDVLPPLVEQLEIGIAPDVDVQLLMKRAEALAEGDPDALSLTSASLRAEAPKAGEAAAGMDPVLTEIFTKEIRGHVATLEKYIAEASSGSPPHAVAEPVYRACHTLYGSAKMANSGAAIELAKPLDRHLGAQYERGPGLSAEGLATLERLVAEISRLADALEAGQSFEVDGAVLGELDRLAPDEASASGGPAAEPAADDSDGPDAAYDPEIAAIFAEEAAELLDQAETVLRDLAGAADQSTGLRELQRMLHTLKGGARMAGVTVMGDLSHALESLLSGMAAGKARCDGTAIEIVQLVLDRLHQMRDGIDAGQPLQPATRLMQRIEALARGDAPAAPAPKVATPDTPRAPAASAASAVPPPAAPAGPPPAAAGDTASMSPPPRPAAPTPAAAAPEANAAGSPPAAPAPTPGAGPDSRTAAAPEPAASPPGTPEPPAREASAPMPERRAVERTETARVDADLLDLLLNGAGEISIFQSRLNQQLHSIEFHLGELGQTVTRLRQQLRNLEAETEAQILHRHQEEAGGRDDFDPLELDRYSTIQQLSRALAETSNDVASINELLHGLTSEAETLLTQQTRVTTELQDGLMQTRMVSFERQVPRLARIVRQASQDTGKSAELAVEGATSQLDRQVLESMLPPLEHLLRNAVVHGIEPVSVREAAGKPATGTVALKLRREGAEVIIDVSDDGAGLNLDAIRRRAVEQGIVPDGHRASDEETVEFILRPGFSTAEELTQAAGRGVGMDVVDSEIKKLGGSMRIETTRGQGTRFLIRLPYTLAITHALIVRVDDETFALPLPTVEGITRVRREQLLEILTNDDPRLTYGDVSYRVQHLGSLVGAPPSALPDDDSAVSLVLIRAGESSTALLTDMLEGSREIVVKTLGPHLSSIPGVSGATILGDGRVTVILDAGTLVRSQASAPESTKPAPQAQARQTTALVVDDSITMRRVTQRLLERRGVRVLTARDGLDAIEVLQEHDVDIILLDIEMPRMDGYQFATHVRNDQRLKDLPIIMVTSRSGEKHRAKAIEIGVNDYLSKPYQEAQIVTAIESLLGRPL